jgi:small subunit ribosomal protein S18
MTEENAARPPQQAQSESPATPAPTAAPASAGSPAPSGPSGPPSGGPPSRFGPGGHGGPRPGGRPGGGPGGPGGPAKRGKRSFVRKKKVCRFCVDKADFIDYKRAEILGTFIQERGKILPRRMTGTCARHQRWLTVAIKRAQNIALLPFAAEL